MILSTHGILSSAQVESCAPIVGTNYTVLSGSGSVNSYTPYSGYYRYSLGIWIMSAFELGNAKQFTGLQLSKAYTEPSGITQLNQTIKIYHTSQITLPGTINTLGSGNNLSLVGANGSLIVNDETTVLDGSWYQTASSGWKNLDFTDNFCYNGTDSVVVMWINNQGSYDLSNYPFWDTDSTLASNQKGGFDYSDCSLPTSLSRQNLRPHLKFNY